MKGYKTIILAFAATMSLTACNDYLDIMPENSQPTENMWGSKSDVESALYGGYYDLRSCITSHIIPLGELRAGCVRRRSPNDLDNFTLTASSGTYCDWNAFYSVVTDANGVIANASKAYDNDVTYTEEEMNSHLCEAYFLRALAYFYIVRNWRDAPLITYTVEDDNEAEFFPEKSSEADIIAQIKEDLRTAIALGAAKEEFDTTWETKGRATIWAIYALMADVCLWDSDFDNAIAYADMILESESGYAPRFMSTPTHNSWFSMFNPGNSEESIFELQYSATTNDGTSYQTNDLPTLFYNSTTTTYMLSSVLTQELNLTSQNIAQSSQSNSDNYVRYLYGSYWVANTTSTVGYVWKYLGGSTITEPRTTSNYDPNFIIYRVAEVMLMKAEALIMREEGQNVEDNTEALALINQIRARTNLSDVTAQPTSDVYTLMCALLDERVGEFIAEGKTWYDFLRIGRYTGSIDYKTLFLREYTVKYNEAANENTIRSVLNDEDAWYLPVYSDEIANNPSIVQNPYYD